MKKGTILLIVIIFFYSGCSTQIHNFSYSSILYSIQNNIKTDMKSHGNYISYKPFLFEFNIRANQINSLDEKTGKIFTFFSFDTMSVHLIDTNEKMFFEFDSFKINSKIISNGEIQNKKTGVSLVENNAINDDTTFRGNVLKDTLVWGKKLLYYSSGLKNIKNADSVITTIFFIKKSNFISIQDIPNRLIKDELYSMIGFSVHLVEKNEYVIQELDDIKILTMNDDKICADMVKRMLAFTKPILAN